MADFGYPPEFLPDEASLVISPVVKEAPVDPTKRAKKAKSKVLAKGYAIKYQWQIMKSLGMPDEEIKRFADPAHWLEYFPPLTIGDLKAFGASVDWRRSFITTDANPYYDSFVRWQFITLKEKKKIKFGKRHTIFSPKDGQPSMDHDRASGEGVGPQEYTLIKMKAIEPFPRKLESVAGRNVFLVAATLRPETMYGQTNCWVRPDMEYVAFETVTKDIFICTKRSSCNMAYQGFTPQFGEIEYLFSLKGQDIMGLPLKAPLTSYDVIYTLPMLTIKDSKGTGVVTSVPSDAPDDYAALRDLQRKEPFRRKYGILDDMVLPYSPVPIIRIPGMGDLSAVYACDQMKVASQNDKDQLEKAKELTYLKGFYEGVLTVGELKGTKVQDAKKKIQQLMVANGEAVLYQEPERKVMSRSGDECVVALCDQWYLDYGEEQWKGEVEKVLSSMIIFPEEARNNFDYTLDWLCEHACSRSYGLGTHMPWDQQYLIESLSDSTIYMAYYTVAYLLQGGVPNGSQLGPLKIRPEQMTREVWDFIFLGGSPPACDIPVESLQQLRREFVYWYPVDLRVSGKDLIQNHLTYFLYNHQAIWPWGSDEGACYWPGGVRANGHLMLNSEKMSKSTGNFMTLHEAVERFTADGTRLALADAGDMLEDANFVSEMADAGLLRLHSLLEWIKEMIGLKDTLRCGDFTYHDEIFSNEINHFAKAAEIAFEGLMFREALKAGFYDLQASRDRYRDITAAGVGMNWALVERFIQVQAVLLCPICPHFSEQTWKLMDIDMNVVNARWPEVGVVNQTLIREAEYFNEVIHEFRLRIKKMMDMRGKKSATTTPKPDYGVIYVAEGYPQWQHTTLVRLGELYDAEKNVLPPNKDILAELKKIEALKPHMKKLMQFVQHVKELLEEKGKEALSLSVPFDEKATLERNAMYLVRSLDLKEMWIESVSQDSPAKIRDECAPGKPMSVWISTPHKPCVAITFINPQVCTGYFTVSVPLYDGDTFPVMVDRVRRVSGISGNLGVELFRYKMDSRSIPTLGDTNGVVPISPSCQISIVGGALVMDGKEIGTHMQYKVTMTA